METKEKQKKRIRRHKRVRAKISGTARCPRLCVFRSNKHIYAQIIDDETGKTLAAAGDLEIKTTSNEQQTPNQSKLGSRQAMNNKDKNLKKQEKERTGKTAVAYKVGQLIAQKALKQNIKKVVFDRDGYKYHGRVKTLAEGARTDGLQF